MQRPGGRNSLGGFKDSQKAAWWEGRDWWESGGRRGHRAG